MPLLHFGGEQKMRRAYAGGANGITIEICRWYKLPLPKLLERMRPALGQITGIGQGYCFGMARSAARLRMKSGNTSMRWRPGNGRLSWTTRKRCIE